MKRTLAAIAALLLTAAATYAQSGAVNFNNRVVGVVDAPVTITGGTTGAGTISGIQVQLFSVGAGGSLTAIGSPIAFRGTSGALANYFDGGAIDIPGTTPGGTATLRVRAWNGASYGAGTASGQSADFSAALGGGTLPPENLANLKAFTVTVVPEPTTLALGALGLTGLLLARRRK